MDRIPFASYDFFGYLAPGFMLVAATDYVVGNGWILTDNVGATTSLFWIMMAYAIGQIIASPSGWLIERKIAGNLLKKPSVLLFSTPEKSRWRMLFPGYFTALPKETGAVVTVRAAQEGIDVIGEALFLHAFGRVKGDKEILARLNSFVGAYGFCRNMSIAFLLAALILAAAAFWKGPLDNLLLAALALVGSVGMFYRYLKFFRQYSFEVFVTYAALR